LLLIAPAVALFSATEHVVQKGADLECSLFGEGERLVPSSPIVV